MHPLARVAYDNADLSSAPRPLKSAPTLTESSKKPAPLVLGNQQWPPLYPTGGGANHRNSTPPLSAISFRSAHFSAHSQSSPVCWNFSDLDINFSNRGSGSWGENRSLLRSPSPFTPPITASELHHNTIKPSAPASGDNDQQPLTLKFPPIKSITRSTSANEVVLSSIAEASSSPEALLVEMEQTQEMLPTTQHHEHGMQVNPAYRAGNSHATGSALWCENLLTIVSAIAFVLTLPFSLIFSLKVVQEYERAVIFRLGRLGSDGSTGPGLFFILPCIDNYRCIDMRTISWDVPPQEILTRDSVTATVDAVVFYRIYDAAIAITNVEDFQRSTHLLAATCLRTVLGTKSLAEILSDRESISLLIGRMLDDATEPWGVKVERVEVKDVRLPVQMQRAMAAEAEANRVARAKVIAAEGEQRASRSLKEAALIMSDSPSALQLRYLQTLHDIAAEKNSTIVFPLPMEFLRVCAARNEERQRLLNELKSQPNQADCVSPAGVTTHVNPQAMTIQDETVEMEFRSTATD